MLIVQQVMKFLFSNFKNQSDRLRKLQLHIKQSWSIYLFGQWYGLMPDEPESSRKYYIWSVSTSHIWFRVYLYIHVQIWTTAYLWPKTTNMWELNKINLLLLFEISLPINEMNLVDKTEVNMWHDTFLLRTLIWLRVSQKSIWCSTAHI